MKLTKEIIKAAIKVNRFCAWHENCKNCGFELEKDDDEYSVRKSRTELAKILNATPKRVKLIQEKALRKLRHPSRLRKLNGYYEKPHKH